MCHQHGFMPWHCCQIISSTSCAFWACLCASSGASGLVSSTCLSVFFLFFYFVTVKLKKPDLLSHVVSSFKCPPKCGYFNTNRTPNAHLSISEVPESNVFSCLARLAQIANCALKTCFHVCLRTFGFGFLQQFLLC